MPDRFLEELRDTIEKRIPVCAHMVIRVASWDGQQLEVTAPLEGNRNRLETAFAGSLNALCTVAGWGRVYLLVRSHELDGDIVIRRSAIRYLKPVDSDVIVARCLPLGDAERDHFLEMLRAKRQAKIDLRVEIAPRGETSVSFHGSYVVMQKDEGLGTADK